MVLLATLLVLAIASRGGDTPPEPAAANGSTVETVQSADEICHGTAAAVAAAYWERGEHESFLVERGAYRDEERRMRALRPSQTTAGWDRFFGLVIAQEQAAESFAETSSFDGAYRDQVRAAGRLYSTQANLGAAADDLGLLDCAVTVDARIAPFTPGEYASTINRVCFRARAAFRRSTGTPLPRFVDAAQPVFDQFLRDARAQQTPGAWHDDRAERWVALSQRAWTALAWVAAARRVGDQDAERRATDRLAAALGALERQERRLDPVACGLLSDLGPAMPTV